MTPRVLVGNWRRSWLGSLAAARYGPRVMRLVSLLALVFVLGCTNGGGASVSFVIPSTTRQTLAGFEAGGRAVVTLEVVCDDGRSDTFEQELATRVDSVGFFVPACGEATLNLTITAVYDTDDPVIAFEASSPVFLASGVNSDVVFTGVAYGELVLDPLGQPIVRCTYEQTSGLYPLETVDMTGTVVVLRVPAGDYDVYCFDTLSSFPNYQPTRVGAGRRAGPDLTLNPDTPSQPRPPLLESLDFFNVTQTTAFVSWNYTRYTLGAITFTLELAFDPGFLEAAEPPVITDQSNHTFTGLAPGTRYYVRLTGADAAGASNTLTGELDTLAPAGSPYLASIAINGQPLAGFSSTTFGYGYNAGPSDATLSFQATTVDATSYVRVESDPESLGSTTSVQVIPVGSTQIDIFVRNADGSASQSYAVLVTRP